MFNHKLIFSNTLALFFLVTYLFSTSYAWFQQIELNPANSVKTASNDLDIKLANEFDGNTLVGQPFNFKEDYQAFQNFLFFSPGESLFNGLNQTRYILISNPHNLEISFELKLYIRNLTINTVLESKFTVSSLGLYNELKVGEINSNIFFNSEDYEINIEPLDSILFQVEFHYLDPPKTLTNNDRFNVGLQISSWPSNSSILKPFYIISMNDFHLFKAEPNKFHFHLLNNLVINESIQFIKPVNFNLWGNTLDLISLSFNIIDHKTMVWKNGLLKTKKLDILSDNTSINHLEDFEVLTDDSNLNMSELGYKLLGLFQVNNTLIISGLTTIKISLKANLLIYQHLIKQNLSKVSFDFYDASYRNLFILSDDNSNDFITIGSKLQFTKFIETFNNSLISNSIHLSLIRNVDLEDSLINQIGSTSNPWSGIFDGNNFSLNNIMIAQASGSLFSFNSGMIKNTKFNFASRIFSFITTNDFTFSYLVNKNKGSLSNLEIDINNQELTGSLNYGSIGIVTGEDVCLVNECARNIYDQITINGNFTSRLSNSVQNQGPVYFGALIGFSSTSLNYLISNVENRSNIFIRNHSALMVGGVIGSIKRTTLTNVKNFGNIFAKSSNSDASIGGIIGEISDDWGPIDNFSSLSRTFNEGNITNESYVSRNQGFGTSGGLIGKVSASKISIDNAYSNGEITTIYELANTTDSQPITGGIIGRTSPMEIIIKNTISVGVFSSFNTSGSSATAYSTGFIGLPGGGTSLSMKLTDNIVVGKTIINSRNRRQSAFLPFSSNFYGDGISNFSNNFYFLENQFNYEIVANNNLGNSLQNINLIDRDFLVSLSFDEGYWDFSNVDFSNSIYPKLI